MTRLTSDTARRLDWRLAPLQMSATHKLRESNLGISAFYGERSFALPPFAVVKPALLEDDVTENAAVEYDPYGARLGRPRMGDRHDLVVCEAFELALGRRFVTIEHGEPKTLPESEVLSDVYAGLRLMAQRADWSRARGGSTFISVTFGGRRADEFASLARRLAESQNPGWWVISECPYPDAFV